MGVTFTKFLGLAAIVSLSVSCGKKTDGGDDTLNFTGDRFEPGPSSDDATVKALDDDTLKKAIDKNASDIADNQNDIQDHEDRITQNEDYIQDLQERVLVLEEDHKKFKDEIVALKLKDEELQKLIETKEVETAQKLADLEAKLLKAIADGDAAVKKECADKIAALEAQLKDAIDPTVRADLEKQIKELEQRMVDADKALKDDLQAQIDATKKDLADFKEYADATYATKGDMQAITLSIELLIKITANIQVNVNVDDEKIKKYVDEKIQEAMDQMEQRIQGVENTVEGIRVALMGEISALDQKIADLANQTAADLKALQDELARVENSSAEARAEIIKKMEDLMTKVSQLEYELRCTKLALMKKIEELENGQEELSEEIQQARDEAKQALEEAIENEKKEKEKIYAEIDKLRKKLNETAKVAKLALLIAKCNAEHIADLKKDFEEYKAENAAEMDALKQDLEGKIADVRAESQKAVQDLDEKIQEQLKAIHEELAELKREKRSINIHIDKLVFKVINNIDLTMNVSIKQKIIHKHIVNITVEIIKIVKSLHIDFNLSIEQSLSLDLITVIAGDFADKTVDCSQNVTWKDALFSVYLEALIKGEITANSGLKAAFFGQAGLAVNGGMSSALLLQALADSDAAMGSCAPTYKTWAKGIFFSSTEISSKLHLAISNSFTINSSVKKLAIQSKSLTHYSNEYSANLEASFKPVLVDDNDIQKLLEEGLGEHKALIPEVSAAIMKAVKLEMKESDLMDQAGALPQSLKDMIESYSSFGLDTSSADNFEKSLRASTQYLLSQIGE